MGKNYVENSLKRFLKRKVKITLGFVVAFMISGTVGFADTAEKGSTQWHKEQAEKYLAGIKDGTAITLDKDITTGDIIISSDNAGGIKVTFSDKEITVSEKDMSSLTGKVIQNSLNLVNGEKISEVTDVEGYDKGFSLNNVGEIKESDTSVTISGEGNVFVNTGTLEKEQIGVNGATIVNKGIINSKNFGQKIEKQNGKAYNYGLIVAAGQEIIAAKKAELYNYGIITSNEKDTVGQKLGKDSSDLKAYNYGLISLVQFGQHIEGGNNSEVYNYGLIKSSGAGQYLQGANIGYNYGIIENKSQSGQIISNAKAVGYNYGIIRNKDNGGQQIEKGGTGYNYGVIENQGENGQNINASEAGTAYNYGIIKNSGKNAINAGQKGKGYNYGVIDFENNTTTNIFAGNVENNGLVLTTTENLEKKLTLGTGNNKGVVLDNSFELKKTGAGEVNNHVTNLATESIDGAENKTYYTKDQNVEFKNNLTGNTLTAVITKENKNPIFKYTGDDKLVLKDSSVMGYFLASGTLLEVGKDKELVLTNSKINTVVGVGSDVADVTAVNLNGGALTLVGDSDIAGKVVGKGTTKYVSVNNNNQNIELESGNITLINDDGTYGLSKTNTDITFNTIKADNLNLEFTVNKNTEVNKVVLNNAELKSIDGSSSTEKIDLTVDSMENIGTIKLGQNDDVLSVKNNSKSDSVIDMGEGNDSFTVNGFGQSTTKASDDNHKELGMFNYNLTGVETITLKGGKSTDKVNRGWHIGELASISGVDNATLKIDDAELHVEMNNDYGKGNVTTSLDNLAKEGTDLKITTENDAEVKFTVGDKFNVSQKEFTVATNTDITDANITSAVIFDTEKVGEDVKVIVKEADDYNGKLDNYKGIYDAMLGALSENDDLREAVNYSDESKLVDMITKANDTAEAFYTTGYAVTKDIIDTYISVTEDFGRKAGKDEWIAYGKYVNSDTEFDGGKSSKGYDGKINGTVGMIEYGVSDVTSYGAVFGQGDTEVDITGGGKLDGDNSYVGAYMKHKTQTGVDLTANIGYTKSDLDLDLATSASSYNMITSGNSDSTALTFALRGTKDYRMSDSVRLQPVVSAKYSLINQDAVESRDANFRIDEQDVTIFEGTFGGNVIKDFSFGNGVLSLSAGAEFVLTEVSKSEDGRYTLYGKDITLLDEEDIADNRIEGHIGAEFIHENGVGVNAKYEMILTDKGDSDRISAGVSYKF